MRHTAVAALEQNREIRTEASRDVVGVEDCHLGRLLQTSSTHHADVHPGDRQDRRTAERRGGDRMAASFRDMAGQMRREMRLDADRSDARTAAAMRDAEGLVQIHVADVGADVAGTRQPDESVQIGAVEIDLTAMLMDDGADVLRAFLEHAVRRRIGEHQRGQTVGILIGLRLEVGDVDVAVVEAVHDDDVHAGHCGAGGIGAVRGGGDQADGAVGVAARQMIAADGEQARHIRPGCRRWAAARRRRSR